MELTEKEKKYCEYVFKTQAKSVKQGLLIVSIIIYVLAGGLCTALAIGMGPVGGFTAICTGGIFLLNIFPVFIWKCKTYDFMYKDLTNGRYQVIRTVIKQKVIVRTTHQANRHIYFCCHGVDEHAFPLSMDLVPAAEKGVPITVVKFPSYILPQGIVMSEDFDRKIDEWEQKNKDKKPRIAYCLGSFCPCLKYFSAIKFFSQIPKFPQLSHLFHHQSTSYRFYQDY